MAFAVNNRQFLDFVALQNLGGLFKIGRLRGGDDVL